MWSRSLATGKVGPTGDLSKTYLVGGDDGRKQQGNGRDEIPPLHEFTLGIYKVPSLHRNIRCRCQIVTMHT